MWQKTLEVIVGVLKRSDIKTAGVSKTQTCSIAPPPLGNGNFFSCLQGKCMFATRIYGSLLPVSEHRSTRVGGYDPPPRLGLASLGSVLLYVRLYWNFSLTLASTFMHFS